MINPYTGIDDGSYVVIRQHQFSAYYWGGNKFVKGRGQAQRFDDMGIADIWMDTIRTIMENRQEHCPPMVSEIVSPG
jgi:hypothetical protein